MFAFFKIFFEKKILVKTKHNNFALYSRFKDLFSPPVINCFTV